VLPTTRPPSAGQQRRQDATATWVGHSPEQLQAMRDGLADLERRGLAVRLVFIL
jgi:hypothetical protein